MRFLAALLLAVPLSLSAAGPATLSSGPGRVALIELYTSEGCSSCPPAERWLSALSADDGLWTRYVPVAFHVSYWDHLGWKDRFASEDHTGRQYAYAQSWGTESVYTPCFVRDGAEWHRHGSAPSADPGSPGTLTLTDAGGGDWRVRFSPQGDAPRLLEAHATVLVGGVSSRVTAGENSGSTLSHDFVAMEIRTTGLEAAADGSRTGTIHLGAVDPKLGPRLAIAGWVTEPNSLVPIQAVGGWWSR